MFPRLHRIAIASCFALVALLAVPAVAAAHAELSGTVPTNEATLDERPDEIEIAFTENVTVAFGGVRVFGPDGSRADAGEAVADGDVVRMPIEVDEPGTYAVSWRVVSDDGHPVRGAFVFNVEEQSSDTVSRDAAKAASEGSRTKDIAFGVARAGIFAGVLIAVGGVLFAVLAAGSWQPRGVRWALLLAIISMVAAFLLDASIAAGLTASQVLDADVLREQASTVYGGATIMRLVAAFACLAATFAFRSSRWQRPGFRYVVLVPFVALAATLSLTGHAVGADVTALRLPLDMLHSVAAAAWVGGLVQLVAWSRTTPLDPGVVERWSRVALGSVVVLVLTGSWAAWEEIGLSLDAVVETTYGRLVLGKVALLLVILPFANLNRTTTVPGIRAGGAEAASSLRRYVRIELALLAIVIALTAWLVQTPPAKVQLAPAFVEKTIELDSGGDVQLVIDPASVGRNEIHVYAFTEAGQVDGEIDDMRLTAFNDARKLGPLEIKLSSAGPGHFTTASATIPFDGRWRFEAALQRGRFDEERARFSADISPAGEE
jgi:copper transport protein